MGEVIGRIVQLQVQTDPVKTAGVGYDPAAIVAITRAAVGPGGFVGRREDAWLVDVHHASHPISRGGGRRPLSIGFSGHYEAMRQRFGSVPLGVGGENIVIDGSPLRLDKLGAGIVVDTEAGPIELRNPRVATPCVEFTSFLLGAPQVLSRNEIREELAFLDEGTRGFLVDPTHLTGPVEIEVGARVHLL